jgi:sugar transferase (PEP-CTERM/EpsH1 system associated)
MNILLTLRQPLLPADSGGKVRSLNIFSRLAKRATIHAVSFADQRQEAGSIAEMARLFETYTTVHWEEKHKYSAGFYGEVLASQLGAWPYYLAKCNRPEFVEAVESLLKRKRFDLVLCDFLHTAAPLVGLPARPKVVFQHNVEYLLRKRKWAAEKNMARKWIFHGEWTKTRAIEQNVCRSFDHVLSVSEDDESEIRREFRVEKTSVLPTGVDTNYFRPEAATDAAISGRIVFVGSMDWDPNESGMIWFLREVYPLLRAVRSNVSVSIVGRNPSPRLRAIAEEDPSVELTGTVSDVRPYIAQAEVVIVPLLVGGGTRIKIPEAMAMAKPVVSTTIGAEGLPFKHGRDLCLADDPDDFAETVVTLLRQPSLRAAIGNGARKAVVENHSWEKVVGKLEDVLERVVAEAAESTFASAVTA